MLSKVSMLSFSRKNSLSNSALAEFERMPDRLWGLHIQAFVYRLRIHDLLAQHCVMSLATTIYREIAASNSSAQILICSSFPCECRSSPAGSHLHSAANSAIRD